MMQVTNLNKIPIHLRNYRRRGDVTSVRVQFSAKTEILIPILGLSESVLYLCSVLCCLWR